MSFKSWLGKIAHDLEKQADSRRTSAEREYHATVNPVGIETYRSYGTEEMLRVRGRVIEALSITESAVDASVWSNLLRSFRQFDTREVAGARVAIQHAAQRVEAVTNEEGFFDAVVPNEGRVTGWVTCTVTLLSPVIARQGDNDSEAHVLVPKRDAAFGVISDLDDTVIQTNVTDRFEMLKTVLLTNARTRLPFEGVDAFYDALYSEGRNPLFYVSGGPWNLYDLYHEFLEAQSIPPGPILLADFGLEGEVFIHPSHQTHKTVQIRDIIERFPHVPFILIGDSGEHDPEIYLDAARSHQGRIIAIYIRNVRGSLDDKRLVAIGAEAEALAVPFVAVTTAAAALEDARKRGFVQ